MASDHPRARLATAPPPDPDPTADAFRRDDDALLWLLDLLAPIMPAPDGPVRRYRVLPRRESPRYLLPLDARKATRGIVLRAGGGGTVREAATRASLTAAMRVGALSLVGHEVRVPDGRPGTPSLLEWLEDELGEERLVMSLAIGPPRPNRKPVLQLLRPDGRTVCFAKMAVDGHTGRLIRNESDFLAGHRPVSVVVPGWLGRSTWKGHEVALYTALDLDGDSDGALRLTGEALLDIARLLPLERCPVVDSDWWSSVAGRREHATGEPASALDVAVGRLSARLADVSWTFGAWHGDLTPWNATEVGGRLHVWDWERAGGPVPLGFDAAHAACQVATLIDRRSVADAARHTVGSSTALLESIGVPAGEHELLVDCYLLEWCLRLLEGARSGSLGDVDHVVPDILAHLTREAR